MFKLLNSQVFLFTSFLFLSIPFFNGISNFNLNDEDVIYSLHIPAISLTSELCNFSREFCLNSGVWMKYMDLEKKNFLFTGHNFFLFPPKAGVFYNLSNISYGDLIYVFFDDEEYIYEVFNVFETVQYNIEVENFENESNLLRAYTCYPNWNSMYRWVVEGRRIEGN